MILPDWLENIELEIYPNADDDAKKVCIDYWKMQGDLFEINTDKILKKYDIENIHNLIFVVNTNSRFYHSKQCAEKGCINTHNFNSRTEFKAGVNTSKLTRNFPFYNEKKYRKTTSIIELFEKERWYCNKHTKIILDKRVLKSEAKTTKEWQSILKTLDLLQVQFSVDDIEIVRFTNYKPFAKQLAKVEDKPLEEIENILSNRNYKECFANELYLPRREAWLLFCDYWIYDDANKWVFTDNDLCRKYKIKKSELEYMLESASDSMPLLVDKYTEKLIKNRTQYLSDITNEKDDNTLSKFSDSIELANSLRSMAKTCKTDDKYLLTESADHIEGLYKHYTKAVKNED